MILSGLSGKSSAQDLSGHLWKDRVLLVYTGDSSSEVYLRQIKELLKDGEGLVDRKIVLYSLTPTRVKKGWENDPWEKQEHFLHEVFEPKEDFEVVLLGLDGSIKLRQAQLLTNDKLFATIDAMPMRRLELENRD